MPEAEVPKEGSVPSAPNVQHRAAARASRPYPLVNRIALGIVIALLAVGLPAGCIIWGIDPDPRNFVAASEFNYAKISIDGLNCVSVAPVEYDAKRISAPKLSDAVVEILGIKTVLFDADLEACPWGLLLTVLPGLDTSLAYDAFFSRYRISVALCARSADGRMNPDKCVHKDIHVFTPRVDPHDLLRIALIGLRKPQVRRMELFLVKR